jgi:RimJ/RimL family protein N-acetyltransferase
MLSPAMIVHLQTDRLLLREFTEVDAALLFELDDDPEVMRFIGHRSATDVDGYRRQVRDRWMRYCAQGDGHGVWAMVTRAGGDFLGWVTLRPATDHMFAAEIGMCPGEDELGYRLRRASWGQGYATEASRAVVHKAFTERNRPWVVATALVGNRASIRVMEKVGLRYVSQRPLPGYDQPAVKYALSREEYWPPQET